MTAGPLVARLQRGRGRVAPYWPWPPVEAFIGTVITPATHTRDTEREGCNTLLAEVCGVSRRAVLRWKERGIPECFADGLAVRLGVHPAVLWGHAWFDAVLEVDGED